jgi:hypothetical protein
VSSVWAWFLLAAVVFVLVLRRMFYRNADDPSQEVRYLIQSSSPKGSGELGAKSGLQVTRYYFRETETEKGPPDRDVFYDELFMDLADPASGEKCQSSIHVATPRGLDRAMVEEQWDSVIGTELLIVRRYDLQTILNGAIDHLQEIYEAQVQIIGAKAAAPPPKAL